MAFGSESQEFENLVRAHSSELYRYAYWLSRDRHLAEDLVLPSGYREPLVLQVLGGFTCEEIGAITQSTPGAVMTRLARARQALRNLVDTPASASPAGKRRTPPPR